MPDNLLQENMKRDDKKSELLILVEGKIKRQTFSLRVFHHLLFFSAYMDFFSSLSSYHRRRFISLWLVLCVALLRQSQN